MQLYQRRTIVAVCYSISAAVLAYSLRNENLWQFYAEPIGLMVCFVSLGFIASDFLTPSLSQISRGILHISDRVSGLTLLAMGNAIPDITSTYQAMNAGASSLAVGELLGGIFFLLTVVLGAMALTKPIELRPMDRLSYNLKDVGEPLGVDESTSAIYNRQLFVQDISIFAVLISLSIYFLYDGHLKVWECILMIVAYCGYATFLVFGHKRDSLVPPSPVGEADGERPSEMEDLAAIVSNAEAAELSHHGNMSLFNEGIRERRANIRRRIRQYLRVNYNPWVRITLRDFLDIWENESFLKDQEDLADACSEVDSQRVHDYIAPLGLIRRTTSWQEGGPPRDIPEIRPASIANHSIAESIDSPESEEADRLLAVPANRPVCSKSLSCDHLPDLRPIYYHAISPPPLSEELSDSESQVIPPKTFLSWLCCFKLCNYLTDSNSYLPAIEFVFLMFTTPIMIPLSIVIPVDHQSKTDQRFYLFDVVRLSLVPVVSFLLLTEGCPSWVLATSLVLFAILIIRRYRGIVKYNTDLRAVAVFILSLCTILFHVHLVVDILMKWAEKFNISNTILGLTVFTWGNSLGDLVSNIIFVEIGVIDIALGACFGSPLLYFLFGVGVDGLLLMLGRKNGCDGPKIMCEISFQVDSHLGLSALGIIVAFIVLGVMVPVNGWRIDKKISAILLMLYASVTGVNIYKEIN